MPISNELTVHDAVAVLELIKPAIEATPPKAELESRDLALAIKAARTLDAEAKRQRTPNSAIDVWRKWLHDNGLPTTYRP